MVNANQYSWLKWYKFTLLFDKDNNKSAPKRYAIYNRMAAKDLSNILHKVISLYPNLFIMKHFISIFQIADINKGLIEVLSVIISSIRKSNSLSYKALLTTILVKLLIA